MSDPRHIVVVPLVGAEGKLGKRLPADVDSHITHNVLGFEGSRPKVLVEGTANRLRTVNDKCGGRIPCLRHFFNCIVADVALVLEITNCLGEGLERAVDRSERFSALGHCEALAPATIARCEIWVVAHNAAVAGVLNKNRRVIEEVFIHHVSYLSW